MRKVFLLLAILFACETSLSPAWADSGIDDRSTDGLLSIVRHILNDTYSQSFDINGDGKVTIADIAWYNGHRTPEPCSPIHAIACQTWYGNMLGDVPEDLATEKVHFLYDSHNRLVRKIRTGLSEDQLSWLPTNYYKYDYDESGNLTATYSFQNLNGTSELKATRDTIDYEYNTAGLVTKETNRSTKRYYLYEYDADGNLVKSSRYSYNTFQKTYANDLTLTYSDFTRGGPLSYRAESTSSYNNYTGTITYDSLGNKLTEHQYTTAAMPVLKSAEYWTYNAEGILIRYEKKGISSGKEVNATKVEYEILDAENTLSKSYTYANGKWTLKGGTTKVITYDNFDGNLSPRLTGITSDADSSSVALTFLAPPVVPSDASFRIYRNGQTVDTIPYVPGTNTYTYIDRQVPNGSYEYLVQTFSGNTPRNVSDPRTTILERTYPKATSLRAISSRLDGSLYYVTLQWVNPTVTDDMQFLTNDVMNVGTYNTSSLFDETNPLDNLSTNTVEVCFGIDPIHRIFLKTTYQSGYATSDTITVDASDLIGRIPDSSADTLHLYFQDQDVFVTNPYPSDSVSVYVPQGSADVFVNAPTCSHLIIAAQGESGDGRLCVNADNNYVLCLQGLTLTSRGGPAINSLSSQKVKVILSDDTLNELTDAANYSLPEGETANGCFSSQGAITFKGNGTLIVKGNNKHAVYSKKAIKMDGGNIMVESAKSDALHSGKHVTINGGELTLTGMNGDAIDLDNDFTMTAGTLSMDITGEAAKGVKCGGNMSISGGQITATASGALKNKDGDLSYCSILKCDSNAVISGGDFRLVNNSPGGKCLSVGRDATISGGDFSLETTGNGAEYINTLGEKDYYTSKCISVDNNLYLQGGILTCTSTGTGGKGISVTNNFYGGRKDAETGEPSCELLVRTSGWSVIDDIQNDNREGCPKALKVGMFGYVYGGKYEFQTQGMGGEGIEARGLKVYDGDITCHTYDDGINLLQDMTMKGGHIICNSTNNDGIDSNGSITITGGYVFSVSQHYQDEAFDTDNFNLHINGGTVIGICQPIVDIGSSSQWVYRDFEEKTSFQEDQEYHILNAQDDILSSFRSPTTMDSGRLLVSLPQFKEGETYRLVDGNSQEIKQFKSHKYY